MRMNLVKENGLEREYYLGRKRNMVSYYKYKWSKEANKYFLYSKNMYYQYKMINLLQIFVTLKNIILTI